MILLALFANVLYTISREIIILATHEDQDREKAALADVVIFSILGFIFLCIFPAIYIISKLRSSVGITVTTEALLVAILAELLASMLYYYGDNINYMTQRYGEELGCGAQCITNNKIAALITLQVSLIVFFVLPLLTRKYLKRKGSGRNHKRGFVNSSETGWYTAVYMIGIILQIDTLYTISIAVTDTLFAITAVAHDFEFCSNNVIIVSSSLLIIYFLIGAFAIIIIGRYVCLKIDNNDKWYYITGAGMVLIICLPLYMLADNEQPLDCAFGYDRFANATEVDFNFDFQCTTRGNTGLRLGLMLLILVVVTILSCMFFICNAKEGKTYIIHDDEDDSKEDIYL